MIIQLKTMNFLVVKWHLVLLVLSFTGLLFGQSDKDESAIYQDWIVRLDPKVDGSIFFKSPTDFARNSKSIKIKRKISNLLNLYLIQIQKTDTKTINFLNQQLEVLKVARDIKVSYRSVEPNDEHYGEQWNLKNIRADLVWHQGTGGRTPEGKEVVVAILEMGINPNHEDLIDNVWENQAEIPENNLDDDDNGYVDDYYGLNLADLTDNHEPTSDTGDPESHGIAVSGVVGAKGDNQLGVSGVNWDVKLLLLSKVISMSSAIEGYEYLYQLRKKFNDSNGEEGAFIVATNNSFGFDGMIDGLVIYSNPEEALDYGAEFCEMFEKLGEVGILSIGAVPNEEVDIDVQGDLPTSCESDFFISVTSSDESNSRVQGAAFGKTSVDLSAPGEWILSLSLGNKYGFSSGTSLACPLVAGVIGLLYSLPCKGLEETAMMAPASTAKALKSALLNGVKPISDFEEESVAGGRLDAFGALSELHLFCAEQPSKGAAVLKIYPNPVKNKLIVDFSGQQTEVQSIRVLDFQGRIVLDSKAIQRINAIELNVQHLPSGIYLIEVITPTDYFSEKIIK